MLANLQMSQQQIRCFIVVPMLLVLGRPVLSSGGPSILPEINSTFPVYYKFVNNYRKIEPPFLIAFVLLLFIAASIQAQHKGW